MLPVSCEPGEGVLHGTNTEIMASQPRVYAFTHHHHHKNDKEIFLELFAGTNFTNGVFFHKKTVWRVPLQESPP
jgi:hypothetical protein